MRLTVLRGHAVECVDIPSAIAYLIEEENSFRLREDGDQREAFEVQVRFNTNARIEASFVKRAEAVGFSTDVCMNRAQGLPARLSGEPLDSWRGLVPQPVA